MKSRLIPIFIGFCALTACSAPGRSAQGVAAQAVQSIGCKTSQSDMWDSFYRIAEVGAAFPSTEELRQALEQAGQNQGLKGSNFEQYVDDFVTNYSVTLSGIREKFNPQDPASWKKALAEMEAGIRVTPLHAELNDQIKVSLEQLDRSETNLNVSCTQPSQPSTPPLPVENPTPTTVWGQLKQTAAPEVYGARRVLAVAYQSCDVLSLKPMTTASPSVTGITVQSISSSGVYTRVVSSLSNLNATDYYYAGQKPAKASCFAIQKDPLIYNFGAKPFTISSQPLNLDLFTHVTTGGPTLGIDCSGYVFSVLAAAGLKLSSDPKQVMKAALVEAYGSSAFKEPENNGMSCLQKIGVDATTSILPGDIGAINGHVIMIDSIGADPLAIGGIKTLADCTAANIKPANFDFVIAQSAAVKNGIGINRFRGADFMPASTTISTGFVDYAVAACRAKFGAAPNLSSPNFSIVRHLKTPECLAPASLTFSHEECVDSCPPL